MKNNSQFTIDNLPLPQEAVVNKQIPKKKFYEKAALSSRMQKEFVDKIQKITWKYKLAEETLGISKTETVTEIQIFDIELKEEAIPTHVLKVIDKFIPYQIIYRFIYQENKAYGITLKDSNRVESYYFSDWNDELQFDFTGITLEKVYQKLVKAFINITEKDDDSFHEIISRDTRIRELEKEIDRLQSKMKKEKQFNRQVEINKILLGKKAELNTIIGDTN